MASWSFLGEDSDSLTAGEWEQIFLLASKGVPHTEVDVDPLHCPTCRIAHATVLVARETSLADALLHVCQMPAIALIDAFEFD